MPTPACCSAAFLLLLTSAAAPLRAEQTPPPEPSATAVARAMGVLVSIDSAGGRLSLRTDAGALLVVTVDEKTALLRAKPGAADLRDASPTTLAAIAIGDRVLARGRAFENGALLARQVVVMSGADIAAKQQSERREWTRRGIAGVVKAVDAGAQEVTLETRGLAGGETVLLPVSSGKVLFKRYAPDSVRFADARPSSLAEIQPGDQLRALGERSADRTRFTPEQVVTGAFRSVTATIRGIDRDRHVLTASELGSGTRLSVSVVPQTTLKRLTPDVAMRLARRRSDAGQTRAAGAEPGGTPPREGPGTEEGGGRRPLAGNGGGTLGDMLDQLPAQAFEDLRDGEIVVFSSARNADPAQLTAIVLVAGLEALAPRATQRSRDAAVTLGLPAEALELGMDAP